MSDDEDVTGASEQTCLGLDSAYGSQQNGTSVVVVEPVVEIGHPGRRTLDRQNTINARSGLLELVGRSAWRWKCAVVSGDVDPRISTMRSAAQD
ncbi:MAG: hypothetical protein H0X61_01450 [Acidimicrobiia bacterium]|nr:hypothetical protein [Acidimicrobiia bacterium]